MARVPFQDSNLIKRFFFTENSKKFSFFNRKFIKENDLIPEYIKNRKKMVGLLQKNIFLETNLTKIINDVFVKNEIKNQEIFDQKNLNSFFNSFKQKGFLLKRKLLQLFFFKFGIIKYYLLNK